MIILNAYIVSTHLWMIHICRYYCTVPTNLVQYHAMCTYSVHIHVHVRVREGADYGLCTLQGKIACANVLSDLYAMGVSECDNMLMLLGVSNRLTQKQRDVVTPLVIKGFGGRSNCGYLCTFIRYLINRSL